MPTIHGLIWQQLPQESIAILAVNNTSSVTWLLNYSNQRGIGYPFIYDEYSSLFNSYQVGPSFGNTPPTYVIIDQQGVVQYRIDDRFNQYFEIKSKIEELLE